MMAWISVVLPTPLRPRIVSTSRSRTCRSTSCRTLALPYPAARPVTSSTCSALHEQVVAPHLAEVGLLDPLVGGDGSWIPLGQQAAGVEDGHPRGERHDDVDVVLDQQQRDLGRQLTHELDEIRGLGGGE